MRQYDWIDAVLALALAATVVIGVTLADWLWVAIH